MDRDSKFESPKVRRLEQRLRSKDSRIVDLNKQISDLTEDIDYLKEDKRINRQYIDHLKKEILDLRGGLEEERKENAGLEMQIQKESKQGREASKEMEELKLKVKILEKAQGNSTQERDGNEIRIEEPIGDLTQPPSEGRDVATDSEDHDPEPAAPSARSVRKRKAPSDEELLPPPTKSWANAVAAFRELQAYFEDGSQSGEEERYEDTLETYSGWTEEEMEAEHLHLLDADRILNEETRQVEAKMRQVKQQLADAEKGNLQLSFRDGKLEDAFSDGKIMGDDIRQVFEKFNIWPKYFDWIPFYPVDFPASGTAAARFKNPPAPRDVTKGDKLPPNSAAARGSSRPSAKRSLTHAIIADRDAGEGSADVSEEDESDLNSERSHRTVQRRSGVGRRRVLTTELEHERAG